MRREDGDWTRYRALPNLVEVNYHYSDFGPHEVSLLRGDVRCLFRCPQRGGTGV